MGMENSSEIDLMARGCEGSKKAPCPTIAEQRTKVYCDDLVLPPQFTAPSRDAALWGTAYPCAITGAPDTAYCDALRGSVRCVARKMYSVLPRGWLAPPAISLNVPLHDLLVFAQTLY